MVTISENLKALAKNCRKYCVNSLAQTRTDVDRFYTNTHLGDGKPQYYISLLALRTGVHNYHHLHDLVAATAISETTVPLVF